MRMIRIYTKDVSVYADPKVFAHDCAQMPAPRREKIDRLKTESGRQLSLGAGVLLLRALKDAGLSGREEMAEGAHGKLYFPAIDSRFQCNLSHAGERAMCIAAWGEDAVPVGCDIEQIRETDLRVARRWFHPEEVAHLAALPSGKDRDEAFFRLWTLKESFVKAVGGGLSIPLDSFCMEEDPDGTIRVRQTVDERSYLFGQRRTEDGYQLAWCAATATSPCFFLSEVL